MQPPQVSNSTILLSQPSLPSLTSPPPSSSGQPSPSGQPTVKVLTLLTMAPACAPEEAEALPEQHALLAAVKGAVVEGDGLVALMGLAAGPLSRHPDMSRDDVQVGG